ncbi:hypothetical protein BgiBS90_018943, partial [Biomphalaria glabrata]
PSIELKNCPLNITEDDKVVCECINRTAKTSVSWHYENGSSMENHVLVFKALNGSQ